MTKPHSGRRSLITTKTFISSYFDAPHTAIVKPLWPTPLSPPGRSGQFGLSGSTRFDRGCSVLLTTHSGTLSVEKFADRYSKLSTHMKVAIRSNPIRTTSRYKLRQQHSALRIKRCSSSRLGRVFRHANSQLPSARTNEQFECASTEHAAGSRRHVCHFLHRWEAF